MTRWLWDVAYPSTAIATETGTDTQHVVARLARSVMAGIPGLVATTLTRTQRHTAFMNARLINAAKEQVLSQERLLHGRRLPTPFYGFNIPVYICEE